MPSLASLATARRSPRQRSPAPSAQVTGAVGYYRGQTLMLALGLLTPSTYFAQLYGHTDVNADPNSGGRAMLGHYGSRILDADGRFLPQTDRFNSSADLSPTAGQMPRLVGLVLASRMYRELPRLQAMPEFSHLGDEVVFAAIGNASCAEGFFWEALNAIGVLRVPAVISIWDDGYGISSTRMPPYSSCATSSLACADRSSIGKTRCTPAIVIAICPISTVRAARYASLVKTSANWAMSTVGWPACRRSMATGACPTPVSARLPSGGVP